MTQEGITQIDIQQVLRQKAPSTARKIPGFIVRYLIRTVHQENWTTSSAGITMKDGVAFMQELIGYFDLNLELVNEENIPSEGRYIFASNHPLGGLDGICLSAIIGGRFDGRSATWWMTCCSTCPTWDRSSSPSTNMGTGEKERRTDRKGLCFGQPDHHISCRLMLTQTKREDTGSRMEEVVYPKGRGIPAGHRTGVFRRT